MSSSSSHSPCAACKFLRRKCTQECVFAPYFPPDQPQKFANVHRVYGASNVAKLLNELNTVHREDAVTSLAYEAEARLRDPIYGCVGFISVLQNRLRQVQNDLYTAKKELSAYIGPQAMMIPIIQPQQHHSDAALPYNMQMPMLGISTGASHGAGGQLVIQEPQQQQAQQIFEVQQQHQELVRFNSGFDPVSSVGGGGASGGFNHQMSGDNNGIMSPSLGLATFEQNGFPIQPQQPPHYHPIEYQLQAQLLFQQSQQQPQQSQHKSEGEES
ncbi:hypothetical protein FNV43_RR06419 [Rhamnella rubrinervis]|uniref:LOB domain-containing protein n=1 Tax=Rhamnella rubrinervis TaxID=2594499 RepID=A0A8K0HDT0_9ROSA|nr:hypothetical protein FNV43_RR06419 [Rhamnella rubrinervis]